ncbi:MAG: HPF/RaiA family ribosome-associated protein [Polyangiales bacterium]
MKVAVRQKGLPRATVDVARLEQRVRLSLGRFVGRVREVRVWISDENGPRGGVDKRCCVEAQGDGVEVRVEERDVDVYAAVARATDRARRAVARAVARANDASVTPEASPSLRTGAPARTARSPRPQGA